MIRESPLTERPTRRIKIPFTQEHLYIMRKRIEQNGDSTVTYDAETMVRLIDMAIVGSERGAESSASWLDQLLRKIMRIGL